VDKLGNIINSEFMDVPEDLTVFDFNYNINKIKSVYIDVINMFDDKRYMFNGRIIKPDNTKNWGDLIPYEIISKIFINTNLNEEDVFNVKLPNKNYKVYSTGSVMGFTKKDSIVWGSGCIDFGVIGHKPKEIHSVRGPLTRDELIKRGIDCPEVYGDPALLYPLIYNPKIEKKYKWGLIPHYIDYESIEDRETIKHFENLGFKIIDICKGKNEFIDELLEVEYVLSSSLHGLIAADAYGLPNARVIISNKLIGGDFKFLDYYKSVNRTEDLGLVINTNTEISEILSLNNKIEIDINRLLNSSPWEVNPEIKNKIM
jgi:pyruvyltransferase